MMAVAGGQTPAVSTALSAHPPQPPSPSLRCPPGWHCTVANAQAMAMLPAPSTMRSEPKRIYSLAGKARAPGTKIRPRRRQREGALRSGCVFRSREPRRSAGVLASALMVTPAPGASSRGLNPLIHSVTDFPRKHSHTFRSLVDPPQHLTSVRFLLRAVDDPWSGVVWCRHEDMHTHSQRGTWEVS